MNRTTTMRGSGLPRNRPGAGSFGAIEREPDGRRWLVKRNLDPRVHRLHAFDSWAVDAAVLGDLRRCGGVGVRLHTTDGETLDATIDAFDAHGVAFDHGFGAQVRLASRYWRRGGRPGSGQLELALFGGAS